ncbi:MAG: Fic family protein [Myxococcales bacterium]|nr:Fic family protein [Myxococcales bacterium]
MKTLASFAGGGRDVPGATAWLIGELGEARGKQELFTRQSPERLRVLREHAVVESAVSSNRIEGVEIDPTRIRSVVLGQDKLRDRNEEEVRGYRLALKLIHEDAPALAVDEGKVRRLHALARGDVWDAGQYKARDADIIERYPDGRSRVRFRTVSAAATPEFMAALTEHWQKAIEERWTPPLIALAAFNLDFLCIHPFRDGNGRASRLLMLLQCYLLGFEVGRYISLERLIEENTVRYYETLEQSSQGWHEGRHDPWPYANFVLSTLKTAYRELEQRVGDVAAPRGAKAERVEAAVARMEGRFQVADVQAACPGVSVDTIRRVLARLQKEGRVECLGRGRTASWRKTRT